MYQPAYQAVHKPATEYLKPFVSDVALALGIALSLLLIWIGAVIWGWTDDPDTADVGMFLKSLGMLILTLAMFLAGLLRVDWDKWMRFGVVLCATLLLIFVGYWSGFWAVVSINLNPFM